MTEGVSNYKPNSHKSKKIISDMNSGEAKERPKLDQIATGQAFEKKKSVGKRISEAFTGDDATSVGDYLLYDIVIPSIKALIADAVGQGTERLMFGSSSRVRSTTLRNGGRPDYGRMYSGKPINQMQDGRRDLSAAARANHDFNDIIIPDRGEADLILDKLGEIISMYEFATVSDLYQLTGITGSYTDDKYGWFDIREARITRVREGWRLNLPVPVSGDQ